MQGYFAGWTDIAMERFKEIWGSMPMLYMLIIFSSLFSPSFWLLVVLITIFGWLGIAAYVRAEFLKNRTLDYVRAARALGVDLVRGLVGRVACRVLEGADDRRLSPHAHARPSANSARSAFTRSDCSSGA